MRKRTAWGAGVVVAVVLACAAAPALAQRARPPQTQAGDLGPGDVQRLFDAYTAMQAQQALALDEEQFARFLPRLRNLQAARRRAEAERQKLTAELARLTASAQVTDDGRLRAAMKALRDLAPRAAADISAAYDALDLTLDVRQQARFRVFELQMERRKFDLMLRARRGEAARAPRDVR